MLLNTTKETGENLMGNPPLKISRNTDFENTCENICCYYAAAVSWLFCVGEPLNPNKILIYRGIFLVERRIMYSIESEI